MLKKLKLKLPLIKIREISVPSSESRHEKTCFLHMRKQRRRSLISAIVFATLMLLCSSNEHKSFIFYFNVVTFQHSNRHDIIYNAPHTD